MKKLFAILLKAAKRFDQNDGWAHSSHVTLSMFMAFFPFCIFALSIAGQVGAGIDKNELIDFIFGTWPDQLAEPIEREVEAVLQASESATLTVSAFLAVYFASNGFDAIRAAITGAYYETDSRPFWKTKMLSIAFVIVSALLLSMAGIFIVALPVYFQFMETTAPNVYAGVFAYEPLRVAVAVLLLVSLLFASHIWLPGQRRSLRSVTPGVSLTIILWAICAQGFAAYINNFASYSVTYAGLAGIMATLVFMYLMAAIFIFGAEFNGQLAEENGGI